MNDLLLFALGLIYFFIPGYLANGSPPVIAKLLPAWSAPMDFRKTWRGKRLLGDHKTWRGALGGILVGGLAFLLQKVASDGSGTLSIPYGALPWWFGFLLAAGAIVVGDAGKSLIKRRLDIKPGGTWFPFDQLDYTIGAFFVCSWVFWPGFGIAFENGLGASAGWLGLLFLLLINGLLSALAHYTGGCLKITKEKC